ncbi:hypothetical protein ABIB35_000940 [Arthrobacter sp. UYP6]|uniref:hypothetical protein n=1 Tax=Arthrobacter sp. UYP6 TaxID=1756378 RepID=UPI0033939547
MLSSITPESIFAQIMMEEAPTAAFFLVEGPDESAVFWDHISSGVVLIVCGGKRNVIGAARLAETNNVGDVYGLVDADFDRIRGLNSNYPTKVMATVSYDLVSDLMSFAPRTLRRSLIAHAEPGVRAIEKTSKLSIEETIYALTTRLAAARLASIREDFPLIFKGYQFSQVIGSTYEPAGLYTILEHARQRSSSFELDEDVLKSVEIAFNEVNTGPYWSGGHDIVAASAALLRKAGSQISSKTIAGTLIAAASCPVLTSLPYLSELTAMARANSGVDLLDCFAA